MATVPIKYTCTVFPRNKSDPPYPATLVGWAEILGLEVGGGPILPPDEIPPVEPPLGIWPGPGDPDMPWPDPPIPPEFPPSGPPAPPHEGWNYKHGSPASPSQGWYYLYVPGPTDPQPHAA